MVLHVAAVDIGSPQSGHLGWAIHGPQHQESGDDIDSAIELFANVLETGPLALGFESPQFVPYRDEVRKLTRARHNERDRAFSAAPGATVLTTGLVVIPYILKRLKQLRPDGLAWQNWNSLPEQRDELLVFEAFVTGKAKGNSHVADAERAIAAFQKGGVAPQNAIEETDCFSLLGAMLLRTGWTLDASELSQPCLVVKA